MPSAGEVEQFAYCAHNWLLARRGATGKGEPSRRGVAAHLAAGRAQRQVERRKRDYRHSLTLALLMVLVGLSFVLLAVALFLPQDLQATLALVAIALVLMACSTTLLTFAIVSQGLYRAAQREAGLVPGRLLQSDLDGEAPLLADPVTGLSGRPDYILRTGHGPVPVEVKTGRTPSHPHRSHILQVACYLHLLEARGERPAYGLLRYPDGVFRVPWDRAVRSDLQATLGHLREAEQTGRADRDHEQAGRCGGCSRRQDCDQRLA